MFEANATSNTNHSGLFDFKGKTYMIYHNGAMDTEGARTYVRSDLTAMAG